MEFLELLKTLIGIFIGAAGAGVPLYLQLGKFRQELKEQRLKLETQEADHKQQLEQERKEHEQKLREGDIGLKDKESKSAQKDKINTEAEWKRIIEFRDAELVRLRERDDQQERQITSLWEKHIQCEKTEAAQSQKIIAQNEKIASNEGRIRNLEQRIDDLLKALIAHKLPAPPTEPDNAAHEGRT